MRQHAIIEWGLRRLGSVRSRRLGDVSTGKDARGARVVAVIGCAVNQNLRDVGAATFPAMNPQLVALCARFDVGLHALPCPEIACLGPHRQRPDGTRLRDAMGTPECLQRCSILAAEHAQYLDQMRLMGVQLLGVVGGNRASPGCAVWTDTLGRLTSRSGVFLRLLQQSLWQRGLMLPFVPMRDAESVGFAVDLARLERLFATTSNRS